MAQGGAGGRSGIDGLGQGGASGGSMQSDGLDSTSDQGAAGLNGLGGAVFNRNGTITISHSTIAENTVETGAGGEAEANGTAKMSISGPLNLKSIWQTPLRMFPL